MTNEEVEALQAEYAQLEARQAEHLSADEMATVTLRMGEILATLQDAGIDTFPGSRPEPSVFIRRQP